MLWHRSVHPVVVRRRRYVWLAWCSQALIDGKVLCVHGGLSPDLRTLDQVRSAPRRRYGIHCCSDVNFCATTFWAGRATPLPCLHICASLRLYTSARSVLKSSPKQPSQLAAATHSAC
jgi:diadenosine tetraphosphatase ApaH/serine/threonine PP2A family protein phosphatase